MKRRSFLKTVGGVVGTCALGLDTALEASPAESGAGELPHRVLGRTGARVSVVGFPGLSLIHHDQERCTRSLHAAFDQGLNYYDVAPAYGNGECEIKMGLGLQGLERSRYFLACKTKMRDKEGARAELERSLQRLKTDHFDLYQLHHIVTPAQVKQALGPGGAIETLLKARDEGKVKALGFSAHTTKGALEAMKGFRFDTVMFPINFVEFFERGTGKAVLKLAKEQGAAVLAIKPLSRGAWPQGVEQKRKWWYRTTETDEETSLALRWTLSQEPVVAGIPPSFVDLLEKAIEAARHYRPIAETEVAQLKQMASGCGSIFDPEEKQVAFGKPCSMPYPETPWQSCGSDVV